MYMNSRHLRCVKVNCIWQSIFPHLYCWGKINCDITFVNLFPKSTITVVLKNSFAGFLSRYFEEIELTLSFFAAENKRDDQ